MRALALLSLTFVACQAASVTPFAVPPKPAKCVVKSADIAFIIDASGSVSANDWTQELNFASNVVKGYDVGRTEVRVALIVFSDTANIVFDFNKYTTKAQVIAAISAAPKESRGTYTHVALDLARDRLFQGPSGMRAGVPHIVMVITDGRSQSRASTLASAQSLHARNITVFAVGVKGADATELDGIASNPSLVYTYTDFTKLTALQDTFSRETCKVAVKLAPTTTTTPPPPTTTTTPTTTPLPTTKACIVETADIGFVVDASGSVDATEWRQSLNFASKVVSGYDIGPNKVRVGMIGFSDKAYSLFNFNKYTTKAQVVAAINGAKKVSGGTATHLGLDMAKNSLFQAVNGMRPGVPNILFVITDGSSNSRTSTIASARALHAQGITVFAVGVSGAVASELEIIASKKEYVYNFKDFNSLAVIQKQFNSETCKVAVKLATIPPTTVPGPFSGCRVNKVDMVFVVDTSSSVGIDNFNLTKVFLRQMVDQLDFSQVNVGIIKFNDKVTSEFALNQHHDATSAKAGVDRMSYNKGQGTVISGALKYMREVSFTAANGDRPGVPNIAVLVTDGQSQDTYRTQYEGNLTKNAGIELFSVGIGKDINDKEIRSLASSPSFVYLVKTFSQLSTIQSALAAKLCQGFTPPPTTTPAPCICKDKEDGCADYGTHICFEQRYRRFAEDKCPVFCDLCPAGCIPVYPPPKACVDKIPDCAFKVDVCTDTKFYPYAKENCPRYCNLCADLNPTRVVQTTTPTPPSTASTTTLPTTRGPTRPPTPTTPYTPCDPNCHDQQRNCNNYDKATCNQIQFKSFFQANCNAYCGFCTPIASCVTTAPCVDIEDCSKYTDSTCVQYKDWARSTCPQRCGLCPGLNPVTLPLVKVCEDKEDCTAYGKDMCTDYPKFAEEKCERYCGICEFKGSTTKLPCTDVKDCSKYKLSDCKNPDFRQFMLANCRLFCDLCDAQA